ncbi:MAG TPA: hypothetical protein VFM56_13125 [Solimonas sp.]|nr:hypothetical protein [Solimonas sp.]
MNARTQLSALSAAPVRGRRADIDGKTQKVLAKSTYRIVRNGYGVCANDDRTADRGGERPMRRHFEFRHCEKAEGRRSNPDAPLDLAA